MIVENDCLILQIFQMDMAINYKHEAYPEGTAVDSGLFQHTIEKVELLGYNEPLHWRRESSGLTVDLPSGRPCAHAFALRIFSEKQN
jgi:hypothetical protein